MRTITVGIDFSKGSEHALAVAIEVANSWDSDIRMISVETKKNKSVSKDFPENLEKWKNANQPKLKSGLRLEYKIRQGKVHTELTTDAKETDSLMIIIGAHGNSGLEKKYIGSNAMKTITEAHCPVLSIREDFDISKGLRRIVLPIDSSNDTRQKVPFTAELAKVFGAQVCILGLFSSKMEDIKNLATKYANQTSNFLTESGVSNTVEFKHADNLTMTTLKHAIEIEADLIAIMSEQEIAISNFFLGSYAQQMVNLSPIPILTMHPEEIYSVAR